VRLLLDEDAGAHSLLSGLRDARHDVERVVDVEVLGPGSADAAVLDYAVAASRALLTYNGADFVEIIERERVPHPGVLAVHYAANGASLSTATIVRAVGNVARTYRTTSGLILDLNHHVW
jgi:aspartate oxidase